ncbi:MAG: hypothetical protein LQ338_000017 [Usnochroma carphineum]|nr:MAG: hypothetical protein LQ338_000017 [Usnochroma carphineum]
MDGFVSRKRQKLMPLLESKTMNGRQGSSSHVEEESDSTDLKLAMLASLFPDIDQATLLDILLASDGSLTQARQILHSPATVPPRKKSTAGVGLQTSLAAFKQSQAGSDAQPPSSSKKTLTRKGRTLHLYTPDDIENHTPCSIIHNFLPAQVAEDLLRELLDETPTFERQTFKLFDNVVQSPHSACFYVESLEERKRQQTEYLYNGSYLTHYPDGKKLMYQSPKEWIPNAAFVNCYQGGNESVGYHSDQLTYLGPRAVIGSLSLGVAREFRVRNIVARDEPEVDSKAKSSSKPDTNRADAEGQIAIHLPHNSLLVMHAEMQEEWKHSISAAPVIDPHPIAGNKRINSDLDSHLPLLPGELPSQIYASVQMQRRHRFAVRPEEEGE